MIKLTETEQKVFDLMIIPLTREEILKRLGIKKYTYFGARTRILLKYGVKSLPQLLIKLHNEKQKKPEKPKPTEKPDPFLLPRGINQ